MYRGTTAERDARRVLGLAEFPRKLVQLIPYWENDLIWFRTYGNEPTRSLEDQVRQCKLKHKIPENRFLIGSFQRDTEGSDLVSPKREKGPDIFCDYVDQLAERDGRQNLHVILTGPRRQFVKTWLSSSGISFTHHENATQQDLRELYSLLDLYPVTSRYEGGPQAFIECACIGVPMISTPVGVAEQYLQPQSINQDLSQAQPSMPVCWQPKGMMDRMMEYVRLLEKVNMMPKNVFPYHDNMSVQTLRPRAGAIK